MKKTLIFMTTLALIIPLYGETFKYSEYDGEKSTIKRTIEVLEIDNGFLVTETDERGYYGDYELNADYALGNWSLVIEKEGTKLKFTREKDTIKLKGTYKGKKEIRDIKIDESPWYENWGLGLRTFSISSEKVTTFWSIDPSNIDRVGKFRAEKTKEEELSVNGVKYNCVKVKVALDGLLAMFFSMELWFDKSDGKLVYMKFPKNAKSELIDFKK